MSIPDMDVTPRRHAGYIRTREFATMRKGYDPDQVRQFLDQVASWFSEMEEDLADARAAEALARARPVPASEPSPVARTADGGSVAGADDPYALLGARVAEILRTADEHAAKTREEAEASVHQMLEQARLETDNLRHAAQEEADGVRQSAREQAEATRQSAQDDADRVRDEAAHALDTARVEAERTVATLSERRSVLTAELQATRSRLMGIVSQLEEDQQEPIVDEAASEGVSVEGTADVEPIVVQRTSSGLIPSEDPRRDPMPPGIPEFVPPPPPARTPLGPAEVIDDETIGSIAWMEFPDAPDAPDEEPGEAPASPGEAPASPGEEATHLEAEAMPPPSTAEAAIEPEGATIESAAAGEDVEDSAAPDAPAPPPEPAAQEPAQEASFLQWTDEEANLDRTDMDLSLPDFPSIDIPTTLEDEHHHQS